MREQTDEMKGTSNRVIVDWRASPTGADLKPAIVIKDSKGKPIKVARGGDARYLLSVDAVLSVDRAASRQGGRRAGAYSDLVGQAVATSPAVCRALPNCSKRAVRRITRSWRKSPARSNSARTTRTSSASRSSRTTRPRSRSNISFRAARALPSSTATASSVATSSMTATLRRTTSWPSRASRNWRTISSTRSRTSTVCRA